MKKPYPLNTIIMFIDSINSSLQQASIFLSFLRCIILRAFANTNLNNLIHFKISLFKENWRQNQLNTSMYSKTTLFIRFLSIIRNSTLNFNVKKRLKRQV